MNTKTFLYNFDVHVPDKVVPPRAVAVLPSVLQIRMNRISPKHTLTHFTRFGPLQGVAVNISLPEATELIQQHAVSRIPIYLFGRINDSVLYMDVTDKDKSNWLGLLPLGDQNTANVWLYEENQQLYGITTKPIASRIPLAFGYSKRYAVEHCLPPGLPVLDLEEALNKKRAPKRHKLSNFQQSPEKNEDENFPMRRYRCTQCKRTFSRLFTLKRHRLQFCTKETENATDPSQSEPKINTEISSHLITTNQSTMDDSRVPSDESLQNYTNHLDFPTNLFDTDRIPNLDTSGSSRSEMELNPYATVIRDDNYLSNYLNFDSNPSKADSQIQIKPKKDEKILVSCSQCNETIVKGKSRQHFRERHAMWLKCECGQIFKNKQKLALHIHTKHSNKMNTDTESTSASTQPEEAPYKCEECNNIFKRRGMLINHMWRSHARIITLPLERRVRHYPCALCPKVYRAAAKRDSHVRRHHPGAEGIRAAPLEGGRLKCIPAACAECPRQYSTRAKLLQHIRAKHPHVGMPAKQKMKKKVIAKSLPPVPSTKTCNEMDQQTQLLSYEDYMN